VAVVLLGAGHVPAQNQPVKVTVTAGKQDCKNVVVRVPLSLPASAAKHGWANLAAQGMRLDGQLTAPGLLTEGVAPSGKGLVRRDLHFVVPRLKSGESLTLTVNTGPVSPAPDPTTFGWKDVKGEHADLELNILAGAKRRPVMRYMYKAYDASTADSRDRTYKVFHHLYDPDGKRIVTNGGHTDLAPGETKKLLYPHHRGLMYAFNRITYGPGKGTTADTWHAKPGDTHQQHAGFVRAEGGTLLGRHRVLVDWHGPKNDVFAKEERELTVYNLPGGTLVEFASRLKPASGTVKLDGDPQHAGFQFRASNDVAAKTARQTYYLRPDGKGKPGETRNWEPKSKKGPVNLPWDAMCFVLDGQRYTAVYLNHPSNPGESRWSERDYGRFGCYFQAEATEERPLVVHYRVWLQNGEMTVPEATALSTAFVDPPKVAVK
jgi:hypothetical protein